MDFKYVISQLLGIQDIIIEDIKLFKKDLRAVITARQNKKHCYCNKCGLQLSNIHEWIFKELKGVPLGIYSQVTLKRISIFQKRWEPKFITNLVCPTEGKVLFNGPGRSASSLAIAMSVLSPGQLLAVERFAVDMHDPFIMTIKAKCPNAQVCVDRFHLVQAINNTFDKVRRQEFKLAKENKDQFNQNMLEPHRRFILVTREKDLSKSELKLLDKLRSVNKNIHTAMLLVEYFHKLLDKKNIKSFRKALMTWYLVVRESKLKAFLQLSKTIRKYRKNIEAYITSGLTTAVSEGLNNKIKVLKRMGYGYSNELSFMRKILQRYSSAFLKLHSQ